jgi:hypothetical protein
MICIYTYNGERGSFAGGGQKEGVRKKRQRRSLREEREGGRESERKTRTKTRTIKPVPLLKTKVSFLPCRLKNTKAQIQTDRE